MKTIAKVLLLVVVLVAVSSCASVNMPISATSNELGPKVGQSSGTIWFGIFGNADAGIKAACQDGGIMEISTVDMQISMVFFGLGFKFTCTVTGK